MPEALFENSAAKPHPIRTVQDTDARSVRTASSPSTFGPHPRAKRMGLKVEGEENEGQVADSTH